ncbi:MAG: hypothetical protein ACKOEM_09435, partial [Planctomycetia bacterium]
MNLADAFSTLAKTGCRLRVEAEGGIILDVSPGCPPVPPSVLQVLAAHRESLVAILAPAKRPEAADTLTIEANPKTASVPVSPYARDLPLKAPAARAAAPSARPPLDPKAILRQLRARLSQMRDQQQVEGQPPVGPNPGGPPAMGVAGMPS